jgi:dUTPase
MSGVQFKLYLKVEDEELKKEYEKRVEAWNNNLKTTYPDSGFDLLCADDFSYSQQLSPWRDPFATHLIDLKVKAAAYKITNTSQTPYGYTLNARSSIYKSPFRLANNVGIIDSGYRGNLMAAVDCYGNNVEMKKYSRYFQICMPTLEPFEIELVDSLDETSRGEGGYGSTGL